MSRILCNNMHLQWKIYKRDDIYISYTRDNCWRQLPWYFSDKELISCAACDEMGTREFYCQFAINFMGLLDSSNNHYLEQTGILFLWPCKGLLHTLIVKTENLCQTLPQYTVVTVKTAGFDWNSILYICKERERINRNGQHAEAQCLYKPSPY